MPLVSAEIRRAGTMPSKSEKFGVLDAYRPKESAQCRARFYTAPKKILSAGYKTLPYKGTSAGQRLALRKANFYLFSNRSPSSISFTISLRIRSVMWSKDSRLGASGRSSGINGLPKTIVTGAGFGIGASMCHAS